MTTPQQARELAKNLRTKPTPLSVVVPVLQSLADQVEALTAQLDSYAMALNETKAERDRWKGHIEAVVDIYFDGTENPEEQRAYVDGAFPATMNDLRIAIKGAA